MFLSNKPYQLYGNDGYNSHVVRLLLEEKKLDYQLLFIDHTLPYELAELNPYHTLPILTNKEIALYEINTIFEYLEERHLAIKLLPATPKERANIRLLAWRIQNDWLTLGKTLLTHPDSFCAKQAQLAKKTLSDDLITLAPLFGKQAFFLSDTLGWCDILLAPFLWRLPKMHIKLPAHLCRPLLLYQERLFDRETFKKSLIVPQP